MSSTSPRIAALAALLVLGACESAVVDPAPVDGVDPAFSMHGGGEYADVMNQGGMGVYSENGAHIVRQPNGLRSSITMPTPQPGSYVYPPNPPEGKVYCEYEAPSKEAVREHARRAGLPADRITEIDLELSPSMFV